MCIRMCTFALNTQQRVPGAETVDRHWLNLSRFWVCPSRGVTHHGSLTVPASFRQPHWHLAGQNSLRVTDLSFNLECPGHFLTQLPFFAQCA